MKFGRWIRLDRKKTIAQNYDIFLQEAKEVFEKLKEAEPKDYEKLVDGDLILAFFEQTSKNGYTFDREKDKAFSQKYKDRFYGEVEVHKDKPFFKFNHWPKSKGRFEDEYCHEYQALWYELKDDFNEGYLRTKFRRAVEEGIESRNPSKALGGLHVNARLLDMSLNGEISDEAFEKVVVMYG